MAMYRCEGKKGMDVNKVNFKTSNTYTFTATVGKKYVVVSIGNGQQSEFKTMTISGATILKQMPSNLSSTGANSMIFQANIAIIQATETTVEANVKSSYDTNGFVKLIYFEIN